MDTRLTRRTALVAAAAALQAGKLSAQDGAVKRYVRYQQGNKTSFGLLEGETIRELRGELLGKHEPTGKKTTLKDAELRFPSVPSKVFAVGLNYKSHIGDRPAPTNPEIFYKPVTSLQHPGAPIIIPVDSKNTHYEGELVVVVGRGGSNLSKADAEAAVFGYSCGNDVSERDWQNGKEKDLQWWRAKGSDTFGPYGPCIVTGIDIKKSLLQTRLNGEVVQKQFVSDLLFDVPSIVSFISRYVTLAPGDLIFTGTPGSTKPIKPGDTVEVEIEGIGVLRNKVEKATS